MGVESFYIVSKISNDKSPPEIIKCLENSNFSITKHTLIFGGILKKKVTSDNEFVINNLIIFSIDVNDNLSFRACFSCYSKAIGIIVDIISTLQNAQFIENTSYGSDVVSLADKSKDTLRSKYLICTQVGIHIFKAIIHLRKLICYLMNFTAII